MYDYLLLLFDDLHIQAGILGVVAVLLIAMPAVKYATLVSECPPVQSASIVLHAALLAVCDVTHAQNSQQHISD